MLGPPKADGRRRLVWLVARPRAGGRGDAPTRLGRPPEASGAAVFQLRPRAPARPPKRLPRPQPPRLMERGQRSEARRFLSSKSARRALLALGDNAPFAGPPPAAGEPSITIDAGGKSEAPDDSESDSDSDDGLARTLSRSVRGGRPAKRAQRAAAGAPPAPRLTGLQKAERSYNRMLVAMQVGAGAVMGSRAELVLGFCGTTR